MENEKQIKVKFSTFIAIFEFIIILILVIGVVCYLVNEKEVSVGKTEQKDLTINEMQNIEKIPLTYDEIGELKFGEYLEKFKNEKDENSKIISYKINSCKMVYYYNEEFWCMVSYDIEVPDIENSTWAAGNGERKENYMSDKSRIYKTCERK